MGIPPIGMCSAVCGGGLCGADIPVPSAAVLPVDNAEYYDAPTRTVPLNADGTVQTMHPVDQEAIFNLTNPLGSVPNDPTRGLDWDAILSAPEAKRLQTAKDRVNVCLATLIANGDVSVEDVSLSNAPNGTTLVGAVYVQALGLIVTYKNLRLPRQTTPTAQKFKLPSAPTRVA